MNIYNNPGRQMALALALILFPLTSLFAADRWWDGGTTNIPALGDGASTFTAGTWNTTTNNWDQGAGLAHVAWNNAALDNAILGGTPATPNRTITLGTAITVNQLVITAGGAFNYTVGAAATPVLTLGGAYSDSTPAINASALPANGSITISSRISGTLNGGLVISHGGDVTTPGTSGRVYFNSNATNDFVGDVTVLSGNLHVLSSLGHTNNKIYLKGGALFGSSSSALTYSVARDIIVSANSAIGLNGTVANVHMELATNRTITGSANLTRYHGGIATNEVRLLGDMSGYTGTFVNMGGMLTIQAPATSAGGWILNGGSLKLNTANDTHIANGPGKPNLEINGGSLNMNGRLETINGLAGVGGFVQNDVSATNSVLTLGDGDAAATFNGTIRNNGTGTGTLMITKIGAGAQVLAGTNQCAGYTVNAGTLQFGDGYSGDFTLTGPVTNNGTVAFNITTARTLTNPISGSGVLMVNNGSGSGTLSLGTNCNFGGPVHVAAGTLNCAVPQTFNGAVTVASGAAMEFRRTASTATSSTVMPSLDLTGATLKFDFGNQSILAPAPLQVTGALTNANPLTIYLNNVNPGGLATTNYHLISYGSFVDASFSSYNLAAGTIEGYITNDTANSVIDLVVTNLSTRQWTGGFDNNWDTTTTNWVARGTTSAAYYVDGTGAWFDDSGNNTAINISAAVNPAFIIVTNTTKDYTFGGSVAGPAITGVATLVKQGGGNLTLANSSYAYSGQTTVSGGRLIIGNGSADTTLGTASIQDDAALVWNVFSAATPPPITGSGSVTYSNASAATVTLNTANGYTGATTVAGGTVSMGSSAAFGTAAGGTTMSADSELDVMTSVNTAEPLTLGGGAGVLNGGAFVVAVATGASTWSGNVAVTGDAVLKIGNGSTMNFSGGINAGANKLIFTPTTISSGGSFILSSNVTAGMLVLSNSANLGGVVLSSQNIGLTNVLVSGVINNSKPGNCGLWVQNDLALGTNTVVTLTNGNLSSAAGGGTGARMVLNNANVPAGVSAEIHMPGNGDSGPGQYRCAISSQGTNVWNGPIVMHGADPSTAQNGMFMLSQDSGRSTFNGNITQPDGNGTLMLRGASGTGIINGTINIGSNSLAKTDPAGWLIASTGNTWTKLQMVFGTIALGTNDALCTNASVQFDLTSAAAGNPSPILNLNGFNQQVSHVFTSGSGTAVTPTVYNAGTNNATLTLTSSVGTNWVYAGAFMDASADLNLELAGSDTLTLTSDASYYHGTTVIRPGATLAMSGSLISTLFPSHLVDVQAGGTLDVAATTGAYPGTYRQITGVLKGNGSILGSVTTSAGATIAPGASVGTLTISSNLNIGGGLLFAVDKSLSPSQSNSVLIVNGAITNNGTGVLTVTNLNPGAPLAVGDKFTLFNQPVVNGNLLSIAPAPGSGLGWTNKLNVDGSIEVVQAVATNPTNITCVVSGNQITLSWPADHLGWYLQCQTNSLTTGLGANWVNVTGSETVTTTNMVINPANPAVFYRLILP